MTVAKTKAVEWKAFMQGKVVDKEPGKKWGTATKIAAVVLVGITAGDMIHPMLVGAEAVPVMAGPDFQGQLHSALKPIHDLIKGFAHEIYAVFMAWGAIECIIGKTQQGFTRMKTATLGYVLLYWVPTIIDLVNGARPE